MTKYCEDCKYYRKGSIIPFSYYFNVEMCTHPQSHRKNLIHRDVAIADCMACTHMREFKCGPDAKLFEPKDES